MSRSVVWIAALLIGGLFCAEAEAAPKVKFLQRTKIVAKVQPLTATAQPEPDEGSFQMEIRQGKGGETSFSVNWPQELGASRVLIRILEAVPSGEYSHALAIEGELTFPDGHKVTSSQLFEFNERGTTLFELCRYEERSLIFAIEVETEIETVLPSRVMVGDPVRFKLEVQRVEGEKMIPLETNLMRTFIGEGVNYAFRLGSSPESDSAHISLTPVRLIGEIAEIEIEISGTLPGPDGPLVLGRKQLWHASRGAATALSFASGEPPAGYRFLVSADF
jgi:hypothetical protein